MHNGFPDAPTVCQSPRKMDETKLPFDVGLVSRCPWPSSHHRQRWLPHDARPFCEVAPLRAGSQESRGPCVSRCQQSLIWVCLTLPHLYWSSRRPTEASFSRVQLCVLRGWRLVPLSP